MLPLQEPTQNYRKSIRTIRNWVLSFNMVQHTTVQILKQVKQTRTIRSTNTDNKKQFSPYFKENLMQSLLKPILYGLESIDGWLKSNYGLLWRDKTTTNVGS